LLRAVALFSKHSSFFHTFLSSEIMESVAKFYASRKRNGTTPGHNLAHFMLALVNNALFFLGLSHGNVFDIMERTGLLGQFIRCVPVHSKLSADILECLQTCLQLVKKKLKTGTATGDILDTVIAGKDGSINEKAKSSLARLQSLTRVSNCDYKNAEIKMCLHCKKLESQMDNA
jgi:hypothetical protein